MNPYSLARDEGEAVWMFDALDTIKASSDDTAGGMSVIEFLDRQGSTVPLHVNEAWDRGFYVLEGEYTFVIDEDVLQASSGGWVFVPRGTKHAWLCTSAEGRILNITVPGGFEWFYREVGEAVPDRSNVPPVRQPDVPSLVAAAERHGVNIVGPPPEVT